MKALQWMGKGDVRVESVPTPEIQDPRDIIVKVKCASICGSDLHIYDGMVPTMKKGDIIGHEFIGKVVDKGTAVNNLAIGDRVVVPATIACGECYFCKKELWSLCDNSNPNAKEQEMILGYSTSGIFGYSHLFGGYPGAFAEYIRVPFADVGPLKVPEDISDEKLIFLSDALPTGYMAADVCNIKPGDTVAVWGCGAVGQIAMKSAKMMGAEKIIAIDRFAYRLKTAAQQSGAILINYETADVTKTIKELTGNHGPDSCIDAVGLEADAKGIADIYDRAKQAAMFETDRPHVLRQVIGACRKGGTVSVIGVYIGVVDKFPIGVAFNKGLTFKMGQLHSQKYARILLDKVLRSELDVSFLVTHRVPLDDAPSMFKAFRDKKDNIQRVLVYPE
jgi:threonine dehydrogenase-like Zn-dependent dehydrogenase